MLNVQQISLLSLLAVTLGCFIWGRWRFDIVAMAALAAAVLMGFVPEDQAFSGLGHPATITVALILIISYSLHHVGATEKIAHWIAFLSGKPQLQLGILISMAALLSSMINNIAALALTMPVAIQIVSQHKKSPAIALMPLSFATILGGMITMIGTPPNIIIASYRKEIYGTPFAMFDFFPVGSMLAAIGVLFIALAGWRLIKIRKKTVMHAKNHADIYVYEVKIAPESILIGKRVTEAEALIQDMQNMQSVQIVLLSLTRQKQFYVTIPGKQRFIAGDILLIEGTHDAVDQFTTRFLLNIISAESDQEKILHSNNTDTVEVAVLPAAKVEGYAAEQIRFRRQYGVNLLAVARRGKSFRRRLRSFTFRIGDVLLLHGDKDELPDVVNQLGCIPLAQPSPKFGKRKHALPAFIAFLLGILAVSFNLLAPQVAFLLVVGAMVMMHILLIREIYEQINWPIVILIAAMIPLSQALESTGTVNVIVQLILDVTQDRSVLVILIMIFILTMVITDILNNAATVLMMAPIASTLAEQLQANPDTFLMAVAMASSCGFLTPIGHHNNTLIMEPGGYKFTDYCRLGFPLQILMLLCGIPLLLFFWPLSA